MATAATGVKSYLPQRRTNGSSGLASANSPAQVNGVGAMGKTPLSGSGAVNSGTAIFPR